MVNNYNPDVPANGDENMSVSNPKIKENFNALNDIFNNDHYKWNASIQAQRGYHKKISFPLAITDPVLGSQSGILYLKEDPQDTLSTPTIYLINSKEICQITSSLGKSQPEGYWPLPNGSNSPNGLTVWTIWGSYTGPFNSSTPIPVAFPSINNYVGSPVGFPNHCFNVQLTVAVASGDNSNKTATVTDGTVTSTGFSFNASSSTLGRVYWFAIGN